MANHASTRTTQLYDRRRDAFTLDARDGRGAWAYQQPPRERFGHFSGCSRRERFILN
jgi:hypothetical protein